MTVYVDELRTWSATFGPSCHLTADTTDELHAFARKIGLQRRWCSDVTQPRQHIIHYDLNTVRLKRRASWKDVAQQARVVASLLTRLKQGKTVSVDNLARLLIWSGLSFDTYIYMIHVHFA